MFLDPNLDCPTAGFPFWCIGMPFPEEAQTRFLPASGKIGWLNNWQYSGIYLYEHFHSTTHECLGCASGWMDIDVFGGGEQRLRVETGDVIIMPAGVSHVMRANSEDNLMIGGYPDGRDWDNIQEAFITGRRFPGSCETHHDAAHPEPRSSYRGRSPIVD